MEFEGLISCFNIGENLWDTYIEIPKATFDQMIIVSPDKRVVCRFNDSEKHYCAMMPKGSFHYLLVNKRMMSNLAVTTGDKIRVSIAPNDLEFGVPLCIEFQEVLNEDEEGTAYFSALTKGVQRSLIHIINKYKNPTLRIERSIILLQHLVASGGKLDFKKLLTEFKKSKT